MERARHIGIIADIQCGGWSTTVLTSTGKLFTVGAMNGEIRPLHNNMAPSILEFWPMESDCKIRQFSAGRTHVLGLSDEGRLYGWFDVKEFGIELWTPDMTEEPIPPASDIYSVHRGKIKQVVAGWHHGSAYIYGVGIVLWQAIGRDRALKQAMLMGQFHPQ